jgi:hypothetical protein
MAFFIGQIVLSYPLVRPDADKVAVESIRHSGQKLNFCVMTSYHHLIRNFCDRTVHPPPPFSAGPQL